jgi:WD40 repeat protein/tRNA A-37 threonylcarbamoyl transferase component Bud32
MAHELSDSTDRDRQVNEIITAYLQAVDAGQTPDHQEWLRRYPEFSAELEAFLADYERVERMAEPLRPATAPEVPPEGSVPGEAATLDSAKPAAVGAGTTVRYFGDYELLEEIGRGGMGVVYKARQVSLNRIVALKMILAGQLASENDVRRFHTEAEAAAQLDHAGIVPIFEVGRHEGQHYFSMGYVEGQSLAARVAAGPLPPREAAEVVRSVAEAVEYAHQKGVIHRDLKPSNILVDQAGHARITDFGLAKRVAADAGPTTTGQVLGTPSYIPPEQAAGKLDQVGPVSDVYGLGAVLYTLVTGCPPFQSPNPLDTLQQVLQSEPAAPRLLNQGIDRDLETIILKCLAKEPAGRYASARELANDLGAFLEGKPIKARRIGAVGRVLRWRRRNRIIANLTALAAVLLAAAVVAALVGYWQTQSHLRDSLLNQARALGQTTDPDRRFKALAALEKAARIRPGIDVRNEYLRWLDVPGLHPVAAIPSTDESKPFIRFTGHFAFRGEDRIVGILGAHASRNDGATSVPAIFSSTSGAQISKMSKVPAFARVVALSEDGRWLIGVPLGRPEADPSLPGPSPQLWDLDQQRLVGELPPEKAATPSGEVSYALSRAAFGAEPVRLTVARFAWPANVYESRLTVYDPASLSVVGTWSVQGEVLGLCCHPRRPLLAAIVQAAEAGSTREVVLWSLPKGDRVATLSSEPTGFAPSRREEFEDPLLAFSPGSEVLLAAGNGTSVKIWNLRDDDPKSPWHQVLSLSAHAGRTTAVRLSPDGRWLASAGHDRQLKVWDIATGKLALAERVESWDGKLFSPPFHPTLQWSLSGSLLLSDAPDGQGLQVWEFVQPLSTAHRVRGDASLLFSPGDRYLSCTAPSHGPPTLIDLTRSGPREIWLGRGSSFAPQAFSHDSARLWHASCQWPVPALDQVYQLPGRERVGGKDDGTRQVQSAAFETAGRRLAAGKETGLALKVIDLASGNELWTRTERTSLNLASPAQFVFSPQNNRLAVRFPLKDYVPPPQKIKSWDWSTGKVLGEQTGDWELGMPVFARGEQFVPIPRPVLEAWGQAKPDADDLQGGVVFSPDGAMAAIAASNSILIFKTHDWKLSTTVARSTDTGKFWKNCREMALSRDGARLAAFDGSELTVWATADGKELAKVKAGPAYLAFAESSHEGQRVLLVQIDRTVLSWKPGEDVKRLCTLEPHEPPTKGYDAEGRMVDVPIRVYSPLVSADGTRIAHWWHSHGTGYSVAAWALPQGKLIGRWALRPEPWQIGSRSVRLAISPDEKRLAMLFGYMSDKVWDADTDADLLSLGTGDSQRVMRFSRDGRYLLYWNPPLNPTRDGSRPLPLRIFDLTDNSVLFEAEEYQQYGMLQGFGMFGDLSGMALADEARLLALARGDRIRIYDPHTGEAIAFQDPRSTKKADYLALPSGKATAIAFDGAATLLACTCDDGAIRLFNPRTGEELATFETEEKEVWSQVALSPSGRWLAVGKPGGFVRLRDLSLARRRLRDIGLDWPGTGPPE